MQRRVVLGGLGASLVAGPAGAQAITCARFAIAAIVPQTGPYASVGADVVRGIQSAAGNGSCNISILVYDAGFGPSQVMAAKRAAELDGARLVVGLFGPIAIPLVSENAPGALIADLKAPAFGGFSLPQNAIALPYQYFLPVGGASNGTAVADQSRAITLSVTEAVARLGEAATPYDIIAAMRDSMIESPAGLLQLNPETRTFGRMME
ncbi:hypothetical protein [Mangrovicoccus sp. HB161399]|uniref:hypothetical protein n=1 Tax=Mangrovicoccus sp. HB161399 TaxID=2720392 RepID=UPI00155241E7|nr:hypothetical protein [Mangrovicoccus sp. HB161399]